MEGVDQPTARFVLIAQHKVGGEAHPVQADAQTPGHGHIEQAEGDGQAPPLLDDQMEKAVARIVVVAQIALKAHLLAQDVQQGVD